MVWGLRGGCDQQAYTDNNAQNKAVSWGQINGAISALLCDRFSDWKKMDLPPLPRRAGFALGISNVGEGGKYLLRAMPQVQ